jgi:anaerobic magnesium-protoporphyrin IX monomethyl ester cyclase
VRTFLLNPPRAVDIPGGTGIPVIREDACEITARDAILPCYSLMQLSTVLKGQGDIVEYVDANARDLSWEAVRDRLDAFQADRLILRCTPSTLSSDLRIAHDCKQTSPRCEVIAISAQLAHFHRELRARDPVDRWATMPEFFTGFPQPDYSSFDSLPFSTRGSVKPFTITYTSKGCPYSCAFCISAESKVSFREPRELFAEIDMLIERYGLRSLTLFDESFTLRRDRTLEICTDLKARRIRWLCNTRSDLVDRELLLRMRDSGCKGISFGVETGDEALQCDVKASSLQRHRLAIAWCRELGIPTHCAFILGLPGDSEQSIQRTIAFAKEINPHSAQFNLFAPYPGTAAWRSLAVEPTLDAFLRTSQHDPGRSYCEVPLRRLQQLRSEAYRALHSSAYWWAANIWHVCRQPADTAPAVRYALRAVSRAFTRDLDHAH